MGIDEPRAWTLDLTYIKRVSKWMQIVESSSTIGVMAWCHRHTFAVNHNDKEGLHWFVYAFDCRVRLGCFIMWDREPLSSISLICPFLAALKKHGFTSKHWALGFQEDGWSCGFQSLHITNLVVDHRGSFLDVHLTPTPPGFVSLVLYVVNADCALRVIQAPGDDLEGGTELPCPLVSLPTPRNPSSRCSFRHSRECSRQPPPLPPAQRQRCLI